MKEIHNFKYYIKESKFVLESMSKSFTPQNSSMIICFILHTTKIHMKTIFKPKQKIII